MRARTVVISGVVVALIAASIFTAWGFGSTPRVGAEESISLPIHVEETFDNVPSTFEWEDGKECGFPLKVKGDFSVGLKVMRQIVVRDESDKIVGVANLANAQLKNGDVAGEWTCVYDTPLSVPKSSFFTVFLDGDRITTLTPETVGGGISVTLYES